MQKIKCKWRKAKEKIILGPGRGQAMRQAREYFNNQYNLIIHGDVDG